MAIEITGKQFNPKTIRRFVQPQFEKQGLKFSDKDPEIGRKLVREGGSSLAHVTFHLKSGLKLKLGVKFDIKKGKILPNSKGLVYSAKLGSSIIPLAKPKGQDYDWSSWIKKISEFVKEKEKNLKPKAPTISKAKATDNKIPNTFAAKLEAKKTERDSKKAESDKLQKSIDDQTAENTKLESEIEGLKKGLEPSDSYQEKLKKVKEKYGTIGFKGDDFKDFGFTDKEIKKLNDDGFIDSGMYQKYLLKKEFKSK